MWSLRTGEPSDLCSKGYNPHGAILMYRSCGLDELQGSFFRKILNEVTVNLLFPYLNCSSDTPSASHSWFTLVSILPLISAAASARWESASADLLVHTSAE